MTEPTAFPPVDGTQPCIDDPELFFPHNADPYFAEPAIALCRTCPFIHECLAYALTNDVQGVWGGTNVSQRERLRRQHGIKVKRGYILTLVDRSVDVRRLHDQGKSIAETAAALDISESTVKRYLRTTNEEEQRRTS